MLRTTAIALVFAATAGSAYAGNIAPTPVEPAVYVPIPIVPTWAGGYVGGQLGYAYSKFDLGGGLGDFDGDSVIGGIHGGYRWALGSGWYLGPEFQYDFTNLSVNSGGNTVTFDGIARLKLVAGYEVGNGLLYASAGFAYANVDSIGALFDVNKDSYVLGLGYDYMLNDNWSVGAEYQYHNFDGSGTGGGDVNLNTIHVRASYHF